MGIQFPSPFINITTRVQYGGEQGLLGLAFAPDYATSRYFYVNYTAKPDGATRISRFRTFAANPDSADPNSEEILLTIYQPYSNHNGGHLAFGPDGYLYLKSSNPQLYYLEEIKFTGVFSDAEEASELECEQSESCDILDKEFPLEDALIPPLTELVTKELSGAIYKPEDSENNAMDDLANLANFIARNVKSNLQKQIES